MFHLSETQSQVLVWVALNANGDFIGMLLPEQVLASLVVPHKQILGSLHQVSTICQFPVDIQKHDVVEPGLSSGWAQVRLEPL